MTIIKFFSEGLQREQTDLRENRGNTITLTSTPIYTQVHRLELTGTNNAHIPVVNDVLVFISDEGFLISSLENVYTILVHGQPQVLREGARVALEDIEYR